MDLIEENDPALDFDIDDLIIIEKKNNFKKDHKKFIFKLEFIIFSSMLYQHIG